MKHDSAIMGNSARRTTTRADRTTRRTPSLDTIRIDRTAAGLRPLRSATASWCDGARALSCESERAVR